MRHPFLLFIAGLLVMAGCNDAAKPNDVNFTKAINQYLVTHGKACAWIGQPFPVDVSESEQRFQSGTALQMAALEAAGLVRSSNAVTVTPSIFAQGAPHRVKRYEPTDAGKEYLRQAHGVLGQSAGFCYGDKTVDMIVKWTEPATMGPYSQTEVTYTYKIADLAPWAKRPDVQREFGDIRTVVEGISKSKEMIDLQLTNRGWEVPTP